MSFDESLNSGRDDPSILPYSLMIIDSDEESRRFLIDILQSIFLTTRSTGEIEEAAAWFQEHTSDITVIDYESHPNQTIELTRFIKSRNPKAKIIYLYTKADNTDIFRFFEEGIDFSLAKPFKKIELMRAIEKCSGHIGQTQKTEKEIEESIQRAISETKYTFLNDIAHHWRNPLNAIRLANMNIEDELEFMEDIETSKKFIDRKLQISNEMLTLMDGTIKLFQNLIQSENETRKTDLLKSVKDVVNILSDMFEMIGFDITCDESIQIDLYAQSLNIALYEIIKNACEAIDNDRKRLPKVEIRITSVWKRAYIQITDHAGGIKPEIIHSINEPYISGSKLRSGSGMGLFIANKKISEELGGRLAWENTSDGAKFTIELPIETINSNKTP